MSYCHNNVHVFHGAEHASSVLECTTGGQEVAGSNTELLRSNTRMKSERPTKTEDGQINLGRRMWRTGWGMCLESETNSRISAYVWKIHQGRYVRKLISKIQRCTCLGREVSSCRRDCGNLSSKTALITSSKL